MKRTKHPTFTTDVFSTTSFGPGHLLGAGLLAGTLYGVTRYLVRKSRAEQARDQPFLTESQPSGPPPSQSSFGNERGTYGKSP